MGFTAAQNKLAKQLPALTTISEVGRRSQDPQNGAGSRSRQSADNVAVLSLSKGAARLGRDASRRSSAEDGPGQRPVIGCIQYNDQVVLARDHVEVFHLDASGFKAFASGIQPGRTLLNVLESLLRPFQHRDIGGH